MVAKVFAPGPPPGRIRRSWWEAAEAWEAERRVGKVGRRRIPRERLEKWG